MENQAIQEKMAQLARDLILRRYPTGWGGAAVIRTEQDHYLTSVAIETANASAELCIEVGAMCEAHKLNERVTHCLCLVRDDENAPFKVLSPCGICQERLRFWGEEVQVAVTVPGDGLRFVPLGLLQPYHWTGAYPAEEMEHFSAAASDPKSTSCQGDLSML